MFSATENSVIVISVCAVVIYAYIHTHLRSYICLHTSLCILVHMRVKLPYVLMCFSY